MFGWTIKSYLVRLEAIRNTVVGGFGYDSWAEAMKYRALIHDFITFHSLEKEWRYGTSALAPFLMKDDYQLLSSAIGNIFAIGVKAHRKNQAIAQKVDGLMPVVSDAELDAYMAKERAEATE